MVTWICLTITMSSKPQVSPHRRRRSISERKDSSLEDTVITGSASAPLVTLEPKENDSNVSEELHAALRELAEVRLSKRLCRSDCDSLRKTNKRLEAELKVTQDQILPDYWYVLDDNQQSSILHVERIIVGFVLLWLGG
ncbi:hypothetical protein KIN20_027581 [Parelaphostrongylus tenuis]|uniref:Uncharacterized protein n=1 Tax=Parelaphostrongylus tenuis TaxID=148309 RepID=A0AAD5QZS3_PARTN|nr:hypothetical protein KIN20_027581 [Parelaphostrongylus tenuis]